MNSFGMTKLYDMDTDSFVAQIKAEYIFENIGKYIETSHKKNPQLNRH